LLPGAVHCGAIRFVGRGAIAARKSCLP
jgi:hypothetical protein